MAKTKISEWSATPASNTDIDGINIAEGCAPSGINDAIREMMAQVKDLYSGTTGDAIAIAGGGTGATTASAARTALGVAIGTDVQAYSANLTAFANGPAFSAYLSSNQTLSNNTPTKLSINTEEYDTASVYDNATNYRFTPLVAGYYQVNAGVAWAAGVGVGYASIYKNGSAYKQGNSTPIGTVSNNSTVAVQVYLNGSSDYVEFYALQNTGASLAAVNGLSLTYFQATLIRSAT